MNISIWLQCICGFYVVFCPVVSRMDMIQHLSQMSQ
jgi:hypothetical protein